MSNSRWEYHHFSTWEPEDFSREDGGSHMSDVGLSDTLREWGEEGWELVSVVLEADESKTFFFKRPRAE